ncbi:hypothetical protein I7I48_06123 [Histoplasma ohiense]|nr:hypothetical protein I7I48_06123 [Histoplasma ohiense (nom. inval.)]
MWLAKVRFALFEPCYQELYNNWFPRPYLPCSPFTPMFSDRYCIGRRIWRFVSSAETGSLKRTGGSHGQPSEGYCTAFLIVQISYIVWTAELNSPNPGPTIGT